jgi:hypothetical protein
MINRPEYNGKPYEGLYEVVSLDDLGCAGSERKRRVL